MLKYVTVVFDLTALCCRPQIKRTCGQKKRHRVTAADKVEILKRWDKFRAIDRAKVALHRFSVSTGVPQSNLTKWIQKRVELETQNSDQHKRHNKGNSTIVVAVRRFVGH